MLKVESSMLDVRFDINLTRMRLPLLSRLKTEKGVTELIQAT